MKASPQRSSVSCEQCNSGRARMGEWPRTDISLSPSTKRAASTWPLRWAAARSGRAGVTRLSLSMRRSITLFQQGVERTRRIGFAAGLAARPGPVGPGGDVEMQPALGLFDKAVEEQRGGDGAGKAVIG